MAWPKESRRHGLARKGIPTVIDQGRRFDVSNYVARGNNKKSEWYEQGHEAGKWSAHDNLSVEFEDAMKYYERGDIGEYVGEIRQIQVQYAGDISYEVGKELTEEEYDEWEEGFFDGFSERVRMSYIDRETDIYDNGGKSFDRYSIVFKNGDLVGMSMNPKSPQGFNQFSGNIKEWGLKDLSHLGKKVDFSDLEKLPEQVLEAIEDRIRS